MWRSYRFRLRVAFVAFAVVAVGLIGAAASARARDALLDARQETLRALATTWQLDVHHDIDMTRRHALAIAGDVGVMTQVLHGTPGERSPAFDAQLTAKFERIRSGFGFADVVFVDASGRVLRAGGATGLSDGLLALAARTRQASNATTVAATSSGVVVGARVGVGAAVAGAVLLVLSAENLAHPQAPASMRLSVIDDTGVVRVGVGAPPGGDVLRFEQLMSVDDTNWRVVIEEDREALLAPICLLEQRLTALGVAVALFFAVVGWWMARRVTRPAIALAAIAKDVGKRVADPDVDDALVRARAACPDDEIGDLADALRQMVLDLRATTVSRDTLDAAHRELRRLNGRLLDAQEDERARVARELHDDVVQRLASLAIELARAKKLGDTPARRAALDALQTQLAVLSEDVHGLSRRLHPSTLDDLGLDVAVVSECRGSFERGGPPVDVDVDGEWSDVAAPTRLALFRVVQESLRNVARHAQAAHVRVRLHRHDDRVVLHVHDDGRGFARDDAAFRPGLGLSSMAERVRLVGGELSVVSSPGQGTTIHAEVRA